MLGLIKGADSVELKLTVPDSSQRSTAAALEILWWIIIVTTRRPSPATDAVA